MFGRIFKREKPLSSIWKILLWWELRRLVFNLVVGLTGVLTLAIIFLILLNDNTGKLYLLPSPPALAIPFFVIVYAFLANICYTAGWISEIIVLKVWKERGRYFGEITFVLGLVFSIAVTLAPAGISFVTTLLNTETYTTIKPEKSELVGIYSLSESSRYLVDRVGGYEITSHQLEFKEDGTFQMTNIPDWWTSPYSERKGLFDSGSGIWEIVERGKRWVIDLRFKEINGKECSLVTMVHLCNAKPPYKIEFIIGDPDDGNNMGFEKVNE